MNDPVTFSIIIPFKEWSKDLDECLEHIGSLTSGSYEIILLPDSAITLPKKFAGHPIQAILTGEVSPAEKRNIGAEKARGDVLAFIDDDAYPSADWLEVAHGIFSKQKEVGALGGPAITPKSDPFWARVSGAVFLSGMSGGFPERYVPCPPSRRVDDWPSVNFLVRKTVFEKIGGFDSRYWPGEDTLFCRELVKRTGQYILYVPDLVVWHHRRQELPKHLRQVGNYGLHRGFFAKRYPETSRRFKYFVPTLWMVFVVAGAFLASISKWAAMVYLAGWTVYLSVLVKSWLDIRRHEPAAVALGAIPYIFITHLWYGGKFIQGLSIKDLKSSLGR